MYPLQSFFFIGKKNTSQVCFNEKDTCFSQLLLCLGKVGTVVPPQLIQMNHVENLAVIC
jgi:hypothetical protein